MTGDGTFSVDFATGRKVDLDELRSLGQPVMPDGEHAWSITVVYAIDDPERALDSMELDERNFLGVGGLRCLLCNVRYDTRIRHHKCPQKISA